MTAIVLCRAALVFLVAGVLISPLRAQVLYGSLVGGVLDQSGSAVPGAKVSATNQATNMTRAAATDTAGLYSFPTLPPGSYTLRVSMTGFLEFVARDIPVTLNNVTRYGVSLQLGRVEESVSVTAESTPLLQTERAEVRTEMNSRALLNLPVPQGRNFQSLFKTVPGIALGRPPNNSASNPSQAFAFNVNGASASINNTRVDGASSTNIWLPHLNTAYVPALESIETVNIVSNSFDAEQGLAGGAAINVQIKSGTNDFHGSAFGYHDNSRLRARNFFLPPDQDKAKLVYNQAGGTLGGPIRRDRLFFFTSFERTSDRQSANLTTSVPTQPVRAGDFSRFAAIVYDPLTGNPDGSERLPFQGNRLPASRIDPIVKKIVDLIPAPNLPAGATSEINNLFAAAPFLFDRWTLDSKVNLVLTQNLNMFGRYSILDFQMESPTVFGTDLEGDGMRGSRVGSPGLSFGKTHNISAGVNYVITPTLIMDANYGFVRQGTNAEHWTIGKNVGSEFLGIPGTNGPDRYQGGWPRFDVGGYGFYGVANHYYPYYRTDDQHQYVANFTWTKQRHEVRWGMDMYKQGMDHLQPEFVGGSSRGPRGRFNFGTGPTRLCVTPDGRGGCRTQSPVDNEIHSFATFLLGLPTQLGKCLLTVPQFTTRNWQHSFYVRDRWRLTPRLTFSFGTRWEYFPVPTRADRGFERYNPDTNKMEIGGIGVVPTRLGVEVSKTMFAPRAGLAYRFTDKSVLRAGYGLTNDPYSLSRPLRTNHPVLIELDVRAPNAMAPAGRLADGIPAIPVPELGNGIIEIPGNVTAFTIPLKFRRGYIQSWNLTLERELGWGFTSEIGYVATRQTRQLGYQELNWAPVGGGTAGQQLFQKFRRSANTRLVTPIGGTRYDSLQARLQRRFSAGLSLDAAYTFGKSITTSGQSNSDGTLNIAIPEYYHLNRAVSGFDRPHNLQITSIAELPFGRGRRWLAGSGLLTSVVSNWQLSSIVSFMSGDPFSIAASSASLNAPGSTQRADQVKPEVRILGGIGPGQPYFDPAAYAEVLEPRFGSAGFNSMRGPGTRNWDVGIFRRFQITEKVRLEFRMESFNFTNTPKFDVPRNNVSSRGFGEIASSYNEREFRLGLRLSF